MSQSVYHIPVQDIKGQAVDLEQYQGKVLLIVNVASKCGLTAQYEGLEKLYQAKKDQGLEVLGFPCYQIGGQDPGSNKEIGTFCQRNYGVKFPMFAKVDVKGAEAHVLFRYLTNNSKGVLGNGIKWNFTKFLINKKGEVVARFAPDITADDPRLVAAIENELKQSA